MKTPELHLNLIRKWYLMIRTGVKLEEYREMKPAWDRVFIDGKIKIKGKLYDPQEVTLVFSNGYQADRPSMRWSCAGLRKGYGRSHWGAEPGKEYHVLVLGELLG